jgi:hypothetical protein
MEAVKAHWKAICDPCARSCSRSLGPRGKSRASSIASSSNMQTKKLTGRGHSGTPRKSGVGNVGSQLKGEIEPMSSKYHWLHKLVPDS